MENIYIERFTNAYRSLHHIDTTDHIGSHIALATILCAVYGSYVIQKASPKASLSLFHLILC